MLFHISDQAGITCFVPRPAPSASAAVHDGLMVWAIDGEHLENMLLPRDCPRVCFRPGSTSTAGDIARLFGATSARRVIAIEAGWFRRVCQERLYCYELPPATFR
ncbi:MAG: hypothetical protein H7Z42_08195, partial [Roseiflexaceae bacterium]|nr:hypothetical protein [Roseiflexaceae bacterium]